MPEKRAQGWRRIRRSTVSLSQLGGFCMAYRKHLGRDRQGWYDEGRGQTLPRCSREVRNERLRVDSQLDCDWVASRLETTLRSTSSCCEKLGWNFLEDTFSRALRRFKQKPDKAIKGSRNSLFEGRSFTTLPYGQQEEEVKDNRGGGFHLGDRAAESSSLQFLKC